MAEQSLRDVIYQVLSSAGMAAAEVSAIGLGMAGADRPGDRQVIQDMLSRIVRFSRIVIGNTDTL